MRKIGCLWVFLAAIAAFVVWVQMPYAEARYRFTVEVDTPRGPVAASSVHAVRWDFHSGVITSFSGSLRGEAVFIDLGAGPDGAPRHVVALLPGASLLSEVLGLQGPETYGALRTAVGPREIDRRSGHLTLVTFTDLADPTTATVVWGTKREPAGGGATPLREIDAFAAAFGPGYAFRRASVEIVPKGIWPFSLIPLSSPQWLFGTPLTRGIEERLPFLVTHRESLRRVVLNMPPRFQASYSQFIREGI